MGTLAVEEITFSIKNDTPRFFKENLLNSGNCTMTNSSEGKATKAQAIKAGYAELSSVQNSITMQSEAHYIVEIDSVVDGQTIGFATFRYGREFFDSSGLTYLAYGMTTGTGLILTPDIGISFYEGITSPDFYVGDKWTFDIRGKNFLEKAFDLDRLTMTKALNSETTISVDLSNESANLVNALIILDSNIDSGATIEWQIGADSYSKTASGTGKDVIYLESIITYPYHTIVISGASDNIQFGELYLGSYLQLDRQRNIEHTRSRNVLGQFDDPLFRFIDYDSEKIEFSFPLVEGLTDNSDLQNLNTLLGTYIRSGYKQIPFFVHFNPTVLDDLSLYYLDSTDRPRANKFINLYDVTMTIIEVPKVST